jgi:NAD(P)-dependent dehydrogenase (short-subunit alcohol dehydrogenase family)
VNKTLLITGGSSGIGEAIAKHAIQKGLSVIILDIKAPQFESQFLTYYPCDLCKIENIDYVLNQLRERNIKIDYLINNAAIQYVKPFELLDMDEWDHVFNVNLKAAVYLTHQVSNQMTEGDHILNISSVHAEKPREYKYAYDASKAALNMFSKEAALTLAKKGIRVNVLSLGATKTPMNDNFKDEKMYEEAVKKIPLGEVADPHEVAKFALYILLETGYATGSTFTFDGGRSLF